MVFAPDDAQMYPNREAGSFTTFVVEESLSRSMEGSSRPTHFRGVTTIVAKLFNIVQPDVAVFGAKDYQQAAVVQRMVRDLNYPVKVEVAPTVREPDGLAMSSRNKYLEGGLRKQAAVLWRSLNKARALVRGTAGPIPAGKLKTAVRNLVEREPAARLDYVEFFEPATLAPVARVAPGRTWPWPFLWGRRG